MFHKLELNHSMNKATDIVQLAISQSKFSEKEKAMLLKMTPFMDDSVLNFALKQLKSGYFNDLKDAIFISLYDSAEAVKELINSDDSDSLISLFKSSINSPSYDFGRFILPLASDIRVRMVEKKVGRSGNEESILSSLRDFEVAMFPHLDLVHLGYILQNDLIFFLRKLNLIQEVGDLLSGLSTKYSESYLLEVVRESLKSNSEIIGSNVLLINEQQVEPIIKNWISDFSLSVSPTIENKSSLDTVQYLTKSDNINKLSTEDKQLLTNLLSFYNSILRYKEDNNRQSGLDVQTQNVDQALLKSSQFNISYEKSKQKISKVTANEVLTAVVQKTQSQPVTPRIPVNIQDILKSQNTGVGRSANSGIINIPGKSTNDSSKLSVSEGGVDLEELRRKAQVKQADIEKKLADLKNRVKT
jgi:hypothetical protein